MKKNELKGITITDLTIEGNGVGRIENMAVFVAGMLPGESGLVRIIKVSKNYAVARKEQLTVSSPERVCPPCPVFSRCGGCALMHLNYDSQLKFKKKHVEDCIRRIAKCDAPVDDVIASTEIYNYRNKSAFPVRSERGELKIGMFCRRSHDVINRTDCLIAKKSAYEITKKIRGFMTDYNILAYDEKTQRGIVRHIVLRETSLKEISAVIVINATTLPHACELVKLLSKDVSTLAVNINTDPGNKILSDNTVILYGENTIKENILGNLYEISPNSFLQVNHGSTEKLYSLALSYASLDKNDILADLYCGAGTITLLAARKCKKVYGIEIVPAAIENARRNAALNGIGNAEFLCADCKDGFNEILKRSGKPDAIILDPPRKGLSEQVIYDVCAQNAERIVYISCDPATLARDLSIFIKKGYTPKKISPVDMFPQTTHVETVVLLTKQHNL